MFPDKIPTELTPVQFEREVKAIFEATGHDIQSFETKHREKMPATDGIYEIDVTIRFEVFGAQFLVLVECKHQKNPIKREVVQLLYDKIRATGAHKGIVFANATFQSGALEYAKTHGIALIRMVEGNASYQTRSMSQTPKPPPWANIPPYVGYLISIAENGGHHYSLVDVRHSEYLEEFLNF